MVDRFDDIKVKSHKILEMCECVICSDIFSKCILTKCGHSFCEKCIMECINLHNFCPACKAPLKKEDLIKNYLIDDITNYVKLEREKEEFNNLESAYMYEEGKMNYKLNRIQYIFFENLKQIFHTFNTYLQNLEREKVKNIGEINKNIDELKKSIIIYFILW